MATAPVIVRFLARMDVLEEAEFIEQAYSFDKSNQFIDAAQKTFESLAQMPGMGSPRPDYAPEIPALRQWRIKGFEDYLIFYRPLDTQDGVEIVRVLHGKRNIPYILEDEQA